MAKACVISAFFQLLFPLLTSSCAWYFTFHDTIFSRIIKSNVILMFLFTLAGTSWLAHWMLSNGGYNSGRIHGHSWGRVWLKVSSPWQWVGTVWGNYHLEFGYWKHFCDLKVKPSSCFEARKSWIRSNWTDVLHRSSRGQLVLRNL